jgi:uncharacterized protein (DUF342 family)
MASGLRFQGTVEVLVDPNRLEARLALSREGDLEYDEGALVRILSDAGVTEGFDIDELVGAVQAFQRSREATSEVAAAQGQAPVAPTSEAWEWESLPALTEEQKALAARVFQAAGAPEVFQVRVQKVKVQKRVAGKQGLFGTAADEVQTVIESREVREKVLVDPNPLTVAWLESGQKAAVVYPPRPGQPGRDLRGKPVPAPPAKPSSFFLGGALSRQKVEVVATASGFLRVGRDWAELVPYRDHSWTVTYSPDKTTAFLDFEPGVALAGPARCEPILGRLKADGFAGAPISPEALQSLLDGAVKTGAALTGHSLVPRRDGAFELKFNPDRTKAFLDVHKPLGAGAPLSLKDLGSTLRDAQLKGFSFDTVKGSIQEFLKGPATELADLLLATGKPATRGKDSELVYSVGFLPDAEVKTIEANLLASPRYLEALPDKQKLPPDKVQRAAPVREGEEFARFEVPEGGKGEDGVDVTGQKIPAIPGNEPPLKLLSNVRLNGTKLESLIDGLLEVAVLDGVTVLRVRAHVDAMAAVHRSDDNLQAWLTLVQGRGTGRRLERALIDEALAAAQVTHGLDETKVAEALAAAQAGAKVEKVLIAEGVPAGNDLTRRLSFTQPQRTDAEGKRRSPIRVGEVAATYRPPAAGEVDGTDVLGNPIPSPDMEVRNLVISSDFEVVAEPGVQVLKALKAGELVFDGENLSVMTHVSVAAVGGKNGNVKFPGEVMVLGGVETGGYVLAGNLKVKGRVGGALLSSDHNIQVADGIHGEGKAVLRAKKHVSVGFVERALVMAVGDVHVGKAALGCTFRVNGKIFQKAPGGGLQGGLTKVRLGLDVMNLGSPSGHPTVVSFGQDYLVEDQIQAEVKETDKLREAIVQLDVMMRKLTSPSDQERLAATRQKKVLLMKMLDKRNLKLINLRDKFDLHVPSEIVVRETLFPGVTIESHGRVYESQARKASLRLVFNEQTGRIEEQPLD